MSWDAWEASQTAATFRAIFPEFTRATDALIDSRISMATQRTPADVWGDLQAQGIAWMTAHMLALLPEAKDMRKGEPAGETMYGRERAILDRVVGGGFRVALNATSLAAIQTEAEADAAG